MAYPSNRPDEDVQFLIDECLTACLVNTAADAGYFGVHVTSMGLAGTPDDVVCARAVEAGRILVTNNGRDFRRLYRRFRRHPGLVILLPSVPWREQISLFEKVLRFIEEEQAIIDRVVQIRRDGTIAVQAWTVDLPQSEKQKAIQGMHILVLGGAGMVGRKFIERLARDGQIGGKTIDKVTAQDVVAATAPAACPFTFDAVVSDVSVPGQAEALVASRPELIVHLAAIVSGEAEANFDLGYRINLDGTRYLFDAIRNVGDGYKPRLIFTSSIAVFGAPFHEKIGDEFFTTPLTSYGTQKAIGELLLCDYSRRGIFDGVGIRLPTICVRPGTPNKAASGFFSNIIREPLNGIDAVLPVSDQVRHWHASPRSAVGFLIHAATMDTSAIGPRRALTMPGYSCTVAEQIEALRKVAGESVVARIKRVPDPVIDGIVAGWPRDFEAKRAPALGFKAEASFEEIIRVHIDDELGGNFVR